MRLDAHKVRATFIEFWPPEFAAYAVPQTRINLSEADYLLLRLCHRPVRLGVDESLRLEDLAAAVAATIPEHGGFLRLGYGSWAAPQMDRFGSLRIDDQARVSEVLTLADRRLAEIARRYVRGYAPVLFMRPFLDFPLVEELRVVFRNRIPQQAFPRHGRDLPGNRTHPERLEQLRASLPLDRLGRFLPSSDGFTLDFIPYAGSWKLSDFNPYCTKPSPSGPGLGPVDTHHSGSDCGP